VNGSQISQPCRHRGIHGCVDRRRYPDNRQQLGKARLEQRITASVDGGLCYGYNVVKHTDAEGEPN
jgi:hypothetical protein